MEIDNKNRCLHRSSKGQTLLEVVVTVGVALVIIGSLVTLINASTRRSTIARQATQASKLAQEGMEIVRNVRDSRFRDATGDGTVRVGRYGGSSLCTLDPYCIWDDLYTADQDDTPTALAYLSFGPPGCVADQWCLVGGVEPPLLGIFSRQVEIRDNEIDIDGNGTLDSICSSLDLGLDKTKRVTVKVTWNSPTGNQERSVTSCLTKWQK